MASRFSRWEYVLELEEMLTKVVELSRKWRNYKGLKANPTYIVCADEVDAAVLPFIRLEKEQEEKKNESMD